MRQLDLKFGIPLIEAASLEEDNVLQDMFAALLVNSTDGEGKTIPHRSYVTILQDFGHIEALLLHELSDREKFLPELSIKMDYYYDDETLFREYRMSGWMNQREDDLSDEVQLAFWNLARLGCITDIRAYEHGYGFHLTPFAYSLLRAVL